MSSSGSEKERNAFVIEIEKSLFLGCNSGIGGPRLPGVGVDYSGNPIALAVKARVFVRRLVLP